MVIKMPVDSLRCPAAFCPRNYILQAIFNRRQKMKLDKSMLLGWRAVTSAGMATAKVGAGKPGAAKVGGAKVGQIKPKTTQS